MHVDDGRRRVSLGHAAGDGALGDHGNRDLRHGGRGLRGGGDPVDARLLAVLVDLLGALPGDRLELLAAFGSLLEESEIGRAALGLAFHSLNLLWFGISHRYNVVIYI